MVCTVSTVYQYEMQVSVPHPVWYLRCTIDGSTFCWYRSLESPFVRIMKIKFMVVVVLLTLQPQGNEYKTNCCSWIALDICVATLLCQAAITWVQKKKAAITCLCCATNNCMSTTAHHQLVSSSRKGNGIVFTALNFPTLFKCSFSIPRSSKAYTVSQLSPESTQMLPAFYV